MQHAKKVSPTFFFQIAVFASIFSGARTACLDLSKDVFRSFIAIINNLLPYLVSFQVHCKGHTNSTAGSDGQ